MKVIMGILIALNLFFVFTGSGVWPLNLVAAAILFWVMVR